MEALLGFIVVLLLVILGVGIGILISQYSRKTKILGIKEHTKASLTGLADLAIDEGVERFDCWLKRRPSIKEKTDKTTQK